MNITLGAEFERRIAEKVESGLYTSASEVIRDGLRLLFEKNQAQEKQLAVLKEELAKGFQQLEAGNTGTDSVAEIFQRSLKIHREQNP